MPRRRSRTGPGPIEATLSVVIFYGVAALAIPISLWLLFIWQRPDEPGGAILYEALHIGFWRAVWWLVLVGSALVIVVSIARFARNRPTRG